VQAASNRAKFGRTKSARLTAAAEDTLQRRSLDAKLLDLPYPPTKPGDPTP
jgi:Domain of unknown function (DUF4169)